MIQWVVSVGSWLSQFTVSVGSNSEQVKTIKPKPYFSKLIFLNLSIQLTEK